MSRTGANDTNLEMPLRIGDDLSIGGMISRFNGNNSAADFWILFANIFGELNFRAGRSKNQDFAGIPDGIQNVA